MEAILGLLVIAVLWAFANAILNAGVRTAGAVTRTARGKGSLGENLELAFTGMQDLQVRLVDRDLGDDGSGPLAKIVEARGVFPLAHSVQAGFAVSVLDVTDDLPRPVISFLDQFQEPDSVAFQSHSPLGSVGPGQGFLSWTRIGLIFPQMLQPPFTGDRRLIAVVRLVDLENPVPVEHGFASDDHPGHLWRAVLEFDYSYDVKGYREAASERKDAAELTVQLGVAVAMADGSLDEREGRVLRGWVNRALSLYEDSERDTLRRRLNGAIKGAHRQVREGSLLLSELTTGLDQVGEEAMKYEAVELCLDIMAADGTADSGELDTIRAIASALGLDLAELEAMQDHRVLSLDSDGVAGTDIQRLLGIEDGWSEEKARTHLRTQFQKWNDRLASLSPGPERENAQKMIELIAEARKHYG